jgi:Family of unknown function (DUF5320)
MPRGDRTGPLGQGPMTGRGAGSCAPGSSKGLLGRKLTGYFGRPGSFQQKAGTGFLGWFGLGSGRDRGSLSGLGSRRRWFNW